MISRIAGWADVIESRSDRWLTWALLATAVVLVLVALAGKTWMKGAVLAWAILP